MSTTTETEQERPTLDMVVRRINEISTLPHVALRVMEVANDPDSGAIDLKEVIETDAALSARILRCVNSSAYATRTQITSLQQAIAYLGLKQIRNLAVTASVSELFKKDDKIGPYCRWQLWRHLVSVGVCARLIAMRRKMNNFEEAFLAGLLHDIGIVLEDQHVHDRFVEVILSLDETKTLAEVERAHLGFDHTALGWKAGVRHGGPWRRRRRMGVRGPSTRLGGGGRRGLSAAAFRRSSGKPGSSGDIANRVGRVRVGGQSQQQARCRAADTCGAPSGRT